MPKKLAPRAVLCVLAWQGLALGQSAPPALASAPAAPTASTLAKSQAPSTGPSVSTATGLAIVLASIAAGAALTVYGLTIDCGPQDHACHRRASLPIFGGVGVASAGSIFGLVLLPSQDGSRSAALTLAARFD